ncbi:hypothetical protein ABGB12_30265 [Actinocorallia sp. B10E7]|uniref:hypothetical protein n=1 Tax=Actinocorallia sp. B10E7 TaxID=3153558 RepID=UPI00325DBF14
MSRNDLALGRALALRIMDGLDRELTLVEELVGGPLEAARRLRDGWRAGEPGNLHWDNKSVEVFTAEISMARSEYYGASFRPCLFDPHHENADARVLWRPQGGAPRLVACCAADEALLRGGKPPAVRLVPTLKGMAPLWEGSSVDARWLLGHHAATGTGPVWDAFRDTPLGHELNRIRAA